MKTQLISVGVEIEETQEEQAQKFFTHLRNELDDLKRKGVKLGSLLSDEDVEQTAEMYQDAIDNAREQQINIVQQKNQKLLDMVGLDKDSEKYQTLQGEVEALTDDYDTLTESVRNWRKEMENLPVKEINERISRINLLNSKDVSANAVRTALGSFGDLSKVLHNNKALETQAGELVKETETAMNKAQQKYARQRGNTGIFANMAKKQYETAVKAWVEASTAYTDAQANTISAALANAKLPVDILVADMQEIKNEATKVHNSVTALTNNGYTGTAQQYQSLVDYNAQQVDNIKIQVAAWEAYRTELQGLIDQYGELAPFANTLINEIDSAIIQLTEDVDELNRSTLEYNMMLNGGIELTGLANRHTQLEQEAARINAEIQAREAQSQAVSLGMYESIADNTSNQIDNLIEQNRILQQQQGTIGITKAKFDEL